MRLKITFQIGKETFSVYCTFAYFRTDNRVEEIHCYVPINQRDPDCCTSELVFSERISKFDQITVEIREEHFMLESKVFHTIIFKKEMPDSRDLDIIQGNIAYMEDRHLDTRRKMELIEQGKEKLYVRL